MSQDRAIKDMQYNSISVFLPNVTSTYLDLSLWVLECDPQIHEVLALSQFYASCKVSCA